MGVQPDIPDSSWLFPTDGTLERLGERMQRGSYSPQATPREPFSFGRVRPPKVGTAPWLALDRDGLANRVRLGVVGWDLCQGQDWDRVEEQS